MNMKKKFRKVPSLDFRYEVSKDGIIRNIKSKKIKKQFITRFGYCRTNYRVNKTNPNYKEKTTYGVDRPLHQLVMECWGPKKPKGNYVVDHIDRNKLNNNIFNLRWVTYRENHDNQDLEKLSINASLGQLNSINKKRIPVELIDEKRNEKFLFNSRYQAAVWLIENKKSNTKNATALARRISIQKYIHGFKIHNINAERLA